MTFGFEHGRWFSPGTTASFTTKTGNHDIAKILVKVALNTKNQSLKLIFFLFQDIFISFSFSMCQQSL
jgi:hypothetical protein